MNGEDKTDKKQNSNEADYVTVRIPRTLYKEVESLIPAFANDSLATASGRITVALALRLTLLRGISAVRDEFLKKGGA